MAFLRIWSVSGRRLVELAWVAGGVGALACVGIATGLNPVPTTINDFYLDGTQPETIIDPMSGAEQNCVFCHDSFDDPVHAPYDRWVHSMMGQSARDPIFYACLAIANQDASFAGELCIRCHAPMAWLNGRSDPPDGSAIGNPDPKFGFLANPEEFEGVSCMVCHRMVDPEFQPGISPPEDEMVLAGLLDQPRPESLMGVPYTTLPHDANFIIDPLDRRRGPRDLNPEWPEGFFFHEWLQSPFHNESQLCATCHDVSNPVYVRQPDGTYALGNLNEPHPTQNKYDQFPIERTFSEWSQSLFALGPVDLNDRFGGLLGAVSSCQDCHMPTGEGKACRVDESPVRPNVRIHNFNGANTWVLRAVNELYDPFETGLTEEGIEDSINRAKDMLARASDMELTLDDATLNVRVINFTGHKLPTGYHEGRRMWVNVQFLGADDVVIAERGAYDRDTATLNVSDTKVYEAKYGLTEEVALATGRPEGPGFHFVLNNKIFFDNRIPPMGFTNAGFESIQAAPVAYPYADGQYWDDTSYAVPAGTRRVVARLYHQLTTREYIEFLRDANVTNDAGRVAYDLWVQFGKSEPTLMDEAVLDITVCRVDWDANGFVNAADVSGYFNDWFLDQASGTAVADYDGNGTTNAVDVSQFLNDWFLNQPFCP